MPVPSWTAIPDSMVAPEAPVSSDLMTRLRDQAASVLGYDPTQVSAPTFTLPKSKLEITQNNLLYATHSFTATTTSVTSEIIISSVDDAVETIDVQPYLLSSVNGGNMAAFVAANEPLLGHMFTNQSGGGWIQFTAINVPYTAGSPDSVDITLTDENGTGLSTVSLPLDNSWYNLHGSYGTISFQGRARATSTDVYLTLRALAGGTGAGIFTTIALPIITRKFLSKN